MDKISNVIQGGQVQRLGEYIDYENEYHMNPEDESLIIQASEFCPDGRFLVVGDRGGRVILFLKKKNVFKSLSWVYEYKAVEEDFNNLEN